MAFSEKKTQKKWIIKAINRRTGKTIAWVLGNRDTATFRKLYKKIEHCTKATFYTDDWNAFAKVLPKERHVIGKAHTITIEQDNSNTRHYLGRMTRRTKIVSRSEEMLYLSLRLLSNLTTPEMFQKFQQMFLSIFI